MSRPTRGARRLGTPDVGLARELEARRHHSHYGPRALANPKRTFEHTRIPAEPALPVRVAQNDDSAGAWRGLFWREFASDDWLDAEHAKKLRVDRCRAGVLGGV